MGHISHPQEKKTANGPTGANKPAHTGHPHTFCVFSTCFLFLKPSQNERAPSFQKRKSSRHERHVRVPFFDYPKVDLNPGVCLPQNIPKTYPCVDPLQGQPGFTSSCWVPKRKPCGWSPGRRAVQEYPEFPTRAGRPCRRAPEAEGERARCQAVPNA